MSDLLAARSQMAVSTIEGSAAPNATLRALLIATAFGGIVLVPSLWYLFHIFKTVPADPGARQP